MARVVIRVLNKTRDSVLGGRIVIADTWWTRLRGFMRRPPPGEGEGLLLSPCRGVHMWGVAFPLDVILVNRHGRVVAIYEELQPGRRTGYHFKAEYALEVPAGTIAATGTQPDDLLAWLPANPDQAGASASTTANHGGEVEASGDRIARAGDVEGKTPSRL